MKSKAKNMSPDNQGANKSMKRMTFKIQDLKLTEESIILKTSRSYRSNVEKFPSINTSNVVDKKRKSASETQLLGISKD